MRAGSTGFLLAGMAGPRRACGPSGAGHGAKVGGAKRGSNRKGRGVGKRPRGGRLAESRESGLRRTASRLEAGHAGLQRPLLVPAVPDAAERSAGFGSGSRGARAMAGRRPAERTPFARSKEFPSPLWGHKLRREGGALPLAGPSWTEGVVQEISTTLQPCTPWHSVVTSCLGSPGTRERGGPGSAPHEGDQLGGLCWDLIMPIQSRNPQHSECEISNIITEG